MTSLVLLIYPSIGRLTTDETSQESVPWVLWFVFPFPHFFMRRNWGGIFFPPFFERNRKELQKRLRTIRSHSWFDAGAPCTRNYIAIAVASDTENPSRLDFVVMRCTAVLYHLSLFLFTVSRPRLKFVGAYGYILTSVVIRRNALVGRSNCCPKTSP